MEKVIKGLECAVVGITSDEECSKCSYQPYRFGRCKWDVMADALALLKAQEPVAPSMDYDGQDVWRCGSCGATLFHLSHTQADENQQNCVRFCRYCGKAVKWE